LVSDYASDIWRFGHGLHASKRFSGRYETILWFTKSDNYIFNLDNVRIPSKYPGKRHFKGEKRGQLSGNPLGKNPSDVWEVILQDWEQEIWDIPNVKANHPEKTNHPCQYPIELVERCVLAFTNEDDWVLDPFAGVGSSLLAAIKNNRRAVGSDKEKDYVEIAQDRIVSFLMVHLDIANLEHQFINQLGKTEYHVFQLNGKIPINKKNCLNKKGNTTNENSGIYSLMCGTETVKEKYMKEIVEIKEIIL
jgi:hypothetical protein